MILCSDLTVEYWWDNHGKLLYYLSREMGRNNTPQKQITVFVEVCGRLISWDNALSLCKRDEIDAAAQTKMPRNSNWRPSRGSKGISSSPRHLSNRKISKFRCLHERWMSKVLYVEADKSSVISGSVEYLASSPSIALCHVGQSTADVSDILGDLRQH